MVFYHGRLIMPVAWDVSITRLWQMSAKWLYVTRRDSSFWHMSTCPSLPQLTGNTTGQVAIWLNCLLLLTGVINSGRTSLLCGVSIGGIAACEVLISLWLMALTAHGTSRRRVSIGPASWDAGPMLTRLLVSLGVLASDWWILRCIPKCTIIIYQDRVPQRRHRQTVR